MNDHEIAAYLDRRLPAADRERAEAHLADCVECREDLTQSYQLLRRIRRPERLARWGLMAAAAAALVLVLRTTLATAPGDAAAVRSGGAATVIVVYGPVGETPLSGIRFAWAAQPGATTYRLTVTRADGTAIWSRSAADTVAILPDSVALHAGELYHWVADALLDDGGTRSTGLRDFRPIP